MAIIHPVRLFRIPADTNVAFEEVGFAVEAFTHEGAREAVIARLRELGQRIRSISHTLYNGFTAVVVASPFSAEDAPPLPVPGEPPPDGGWGGGEWGGDGWGS